MTELLRPLLVNADDLQRITGCGRYAADALAKEAGAKIKIGKKCVYDVRKIKEYLESHENISIAT